MTTAHHNEQHPAPYDGVLPSQIRTLRLFLSHAPTRTPAIVLYVASFGGALHAAVTTYYYLAVGATATDIGRLGFVMSAGALVGAPLSGAALDAHGPWAPLSVTAAACAGGCLWRGMATSVSSLRMGAVLLGLGVNMWTVVLGHLVKSFPPSMRSEVLSGFGVQIAVLQLVGKGVFPMAEYFLHQIVGLEDTLLRYRIHMGICTFFCFYGTFALFWDRKNVTGGTFGTVEGDSLTDAIRCRQRHIDALDDLEGGGHSTANSLQSASVSLVLPSKEIELVSMSNHDDSKSVPSTPLDYSGKSLSTSFIYSSSTFLNETGPLSLQVDKSRMLRTKESNSTQQRKQFAITITLTLALLLQSVASTVLSVLWPLLAHDRFNLSAHTFGIFTFTSSLASAGAVAAFPIIERLEKIGGRVRCAAWGFGACSVFCLLFCFCSFGDLWSEVEMNLSGVDSGNGSVDSKINEDEGVLQQLHSRNQLGLHALTAIAFHATLCFLEPSLKSILSLVVNSSPIAPASKGSSLGGTMGFMQSLGNIGGMVGNIAGTVLYKFSKDIASSENAERTIRGQTFIQEGSLPFVVLAFMMAGISILIWQLEEPAENGEHKVSIESVEDSEEDRSGCCLALRETTYNLKLD
jgi:MFS family permease